MKFFSKFGKRNIIFPNIVMIYLPILILYYSCAYLPVIVIILAKESHFVSQNPDLTISADTPANKPGRLWYMVMVPTQFNKNIGLCFRQKNMNAQV